jgi:hypothetical protein
MESKPMTKFSRILILTAAVMAPAALANAQAPTTASKTMAKPAATKPTKPATATSLVASGKIAKFDAASNMLTVTTAKGDVMFTLSEKTSLKEGAKVIQTSALAGLAGHDARVQYSEKDGAKTVASVHVTAAVAKAKSSK